MFLCEHMEPTVGAVLADIGPLGIARVWIGLAALIEEHAYIAAGDEELRWQAPLSLLCL